MLVDRVVVKCKHCDKDIVDLECNKRKFCNKICKDLFYKGRSNAANKKSSPRKGKTRLDICNGDIKKATQWSSNASKSLKGKPKFIMQPGKNCDTKPELAFQKVLTDNNIHYVKHHRIYLGERRSCIPDMVINNRIVIFIDGDYWHNFPHGTSKDHETNALLENMHYVVVRIWEWEVYKESTIKYWLGYIKSCIDTNNLIDDMLAKIQIKERPNV